MGVFDIENAVTWTLCIFHKTSPELIWWLFVAKELDWVWLAYIRNNAKVGLLSFLVIFLHFVPQLRFESVKPSMTKFGTNTI